MLEKLRRKRRDELERYDLGGVYDDIAQELRDVVEMERSGIDEKRSNTAFNLDASPTDTAYRPTIFSASTSFGLIRRIAP